jgi:hypothetical protein
VTNRCVVLPALDRRSCVKSYSGLGYPYIKRVTPHDAAWTASLETVYMGFCSSCGLHGFILPTLSSPPKIAFPPTLSSPPTISSPLSPRSVSSICLSFFSDLFSSSRLLYALFLPYVVTSSSSLDCEFFSALLVFGFFPLACVKLLPLPPQLLSLSRPVHHLGSFLPAAILFLCCFEHFLAPLPIDLPPNLPSSSHCRLPFGRGLCLPVSCSSFLSIFCFPALLHVKLPPLDNPRLLLLSTKLQVYFLLSPSRIPIFILLIGSFLYLSLRFASLSLPYLSVYFDHKIVSAQLIPSTPFPTYQNFLLVYHHFFLLSSCACQYTLFSPRCLSFFVVDTGSFPTC